MKPNLRRALFPASLLLVLSACNSQGGGSGGSTAASTSGGAPDGGTTSSAASTSGTGGATMATASSTSGTGGSACSPHLTAPIMLPGVAAGINLGGTVGTTHPGLTLTQAEQIDCPCATGFGGATGTGGATGAGGADAGVPDAWCSLSANGEVLFEYRVSDQIGVAITLSPGYLGTMGFRSRNGSDAFVIAVYTLPTKNGAPYYFDWDSTAFAKSPKFDAEINEIYDALTATFAPGLPQDLDCQGSGSCVVTAWGDAASMFFPKLGFQLVVPSTVVGQPTASMPVQITLTEP